MESIGRSERGQASVELVGALPIVLLLAAVAWQCALTGHVALTAAHAARAAARADVVGESAVAAARTAVPDAMEDGLALERRDGALRARLQVPLLVPGWDLPLRLGATASLGQRP